MLLDVRTTAVRLGLGESTIRQLIWARELPAIRVGRRVLIEDTAIEEFIATHRGTEETPR